MAGLRIFQINAMRSHTVMQEIRKVAEESEVDIICVQEPASCAGRLPSVPVKAQVLSVGQVPMSAVVVLNTAIRSTLIAQFCSEHVVVCEVNVPILRFSFYIVNVYCQFGRPMEEFIEPLRDVLLGLSGRFVLVTMDANAKSHLWFSDERDTRGEMLEDLIMEGQLQVMNCPGNPPTYFNRAGASSNIDVTLASAGLARYVTDWQVLSGMTVSDHQIILFGISEEVVAEPLEWAERYQFFNTDWERLVQECEPPELGEGDFDIDWAVEELVSSILNAIEAAVPRVVGCVRGARIPWTPELTELRRSVRIERRNYQRGFGEAERQFHLARYRHMKAEYRQLIKETRRKEWRKYVRDTLSLDPWGVPYKIVREKVRAPTVLSTVSVEGAQPTTSWIETADVLLRSLLPDDEEAGEDPAQQAVRRGLLLPYDNDAAVYPFTIEEVCGVLRSFAPNKAPGPDGIPPRVLWVLAPKIAPTVCKIYNQCLLKGHFPRKWKVADVVIIKKGADRDPMLPKSYRPICLLDVLGKSLEKLLCSRLASHRVLCGMNNWQFGFRKGRSTQDAVNAVKHLVDSATSRYVLGLMVDIAGAFDNLWWPALFSRLREIGCPRPLYECLTAYCSDRIARLSAPGTVVSKVITKGCPQGSVCGPVFWDLNMEPLLDALHSDPAVHGAVAYADDLFILVQADSRVLIEERVACAIEVLREWCNVTKLSVAPNKTTYMLLKGSLLRNPMLHVDGTAIRRQRVARYLGVWLDERWTFMSHIEQVTSRSLALFNKLISIGQRTFHLPSSAIKMYNNCLLAPIVGYGSSVWAHRLTLVKPAMAVRRVQRNVILRCVGGFGTTSALALLVIMGLCPLDLVIRQHAAIYWLKKGDFDRARGIMGCPVFTIIEVKAKVFELWQSLWDTADVGRRVYGLLPSIRERLKMKHLVPSQGVVHFLSGHGPYPVYLHRIGRRLTWECDCGAPQGTPEHVLFECPILAQVASVGRRAIGTNDVKEILHCPEKYRAFSDLCDTVSAFFKGVFNQQRHLAGLGND